MRAFTQRLASGLHFSQTLLMIVWRIGQRGIIKLKAEPRGWGRGGSYDNNLGEGCQWFDHGMW